ncbi:MAG TPA: Rne/Rng family ribonuclease [Pseudomonadales bacterium]
MPEELLINVTDFETRVALLAGGTVQELHLARADGYSLTGNIYLGKVERIVPGMQAAFVDLGLERPGFLHLRDIEGPRLMLGEVPDRPTDIRDVLHDGQHLMVQVAKDPIAGKGARLTTQLAIASRYIVLMPFNDHIGISQRIEEETERERLRSLIEARRAALGIGMGFIARTAAEGVIEPVVDGEIRLLARIWERLLEKKRQVTCPAALYQEIPLHIRVVRDLAGPSLTRILIDHEQTFRRVRDFVDEFLPEFADRVQLYQEPRPLFERYGIEEELSRALSKRVPLKSGGYLVIEQTEAMITIDVNTGGFLGASNLEDTVFRTNLEAAQAIPRQLRLRNLGGIIVIDFIDMEDEEHRRQVLRALEKACEADPARIRLDGFSSLGLVQMSRKRTRESLAQQVCEPCSECDGLGLVKTPQTTCIEVFRAILQDARARCRTVRLGTDEDRGEYLIRASEAVVDRLLDEDAAQLAALSREVGRNVRIQVEPSYGPGQFDLVLVQGIQRPAPL